ncbi:MAG: aminotransferase class I/II-fold pyridoxal phosphate-dependent enzyme [Rikenellaceae bacterium]|jgi:O-acetylhomoserine (thiol)-lyase|nr:aminotransferase class I/II-fold pyridoxal phosphate-dependent enzyme [Rikenellaceae bacterium]
MESTKLRYETLQVHAGQSTDEQTLSRAVPIYQTTAYEFRSAEHGARLFKLEEFGNIYTRLQNPTTDVFEQRIAALEGGVAALATASGHSAEVLLLTSLMSAGQNFVSSPYLYGGSYNMFTNTLSRMGIECRMAVDLDPKGMEMLIDQNTRAIFVESIGNSNFAVPDFEALAELAHSYGIPLVVDNTFGAAGYLCRPLDHGADILIESATKWIGGHGTAMGGIIVDGGKVDWGNGKFPQIDGPSPSYHGLNLWKAFGAAALAVKLRVEGIRDQGQCLSPFNSFLLLQGCETLSLRVERAAHNALELARWFAAHPAVKSVSYPGLESDEHHAMAQKYLRNGFGCVLSIELKGDKDQAVKFVESLSLVSHVVNMGDVRTLIIQPAATTHSQLSPEALAAAGVTPTTLRIATGIEHIDDLKDDFSLGFAAIG